MNSMEYNNKGDILLRMKRNAANYLGLDTIERLDPVIDLFIESFSEEIYKLTGELENMEYRILEKLTDLLVPHIFLSSFPAHGVLHLTPLEAECTVTGKASFKCPFYSKRNLPELYFHPVCNLKIKKVDIRYLVISELCYSLGPDQSKTLVARSRRTNENSFWIGLDVDSLVDNLEGLCFFIDFQIAEKEEYLSILPFFSWHVNGSAINMEEGLPLIPEETEDEMYRQFEELEAACKTKEHILSVYRKHFFTIKGDLFAGDTKEYFPNRLKPFFSKQFVEGCTLPLAWIEVKYPDSFKPEILSSMVISTNAFPVLNIGKKTKTVDVTRFSQVIPLETGENEYFFSMDSVADSKGFVYHELPFRNTPDRSYQTYSIRQGGYERFDFRDARKYLINLSAILNKYAASIATGNVDEDESLKRIANQARGLVRSLQKDVIGQITEREPGHYLLTDSIEEDEIFYIRYWITNGSKANHIKAGTGLKEMENMQAMPGSTLFLTSTQGGTDTPLGEQRNRLQREVLDGQAVITCDDDILAFCKNEFKGLLNGVDVRRGLAKDPDKPNSFFRTIDVYLIINKQAGIEVKEADKQAFRQKLIRNSPQTFNYRVFLDKN